MFIDQLHKHCEEKLYNKEYSEGEVIKVPQIILDIIAEDLKERYGDVGKYEVTCNNSYELNTGFGKVKFELQPNVKLVGFNLNQYLVSQNV